MPSNIDLDTLFSLPPEDETVFQREERCRKTLKTVGKAIFMRLIMMVLFVLVAINVEQAWLFLILLPVVLMNLGGILPLWKEWKTRKAELNRILDEE